MKSDEVNHLWAPECDVMTWGPTLDVSQERRGSTVATTPATARADMGGLWQRPVLSETQAWSHQ